MAVKVVIQRKETNQNKNQSSEESEKETQLQVGGETKPKKKNPTLKSAHLTKMRIKGHSLADVCCEQNGAKS